MTHASGVVRDLQGPLDEIGSAHRAFVVAVEEAKKIDDSEAFGAALGHAQDNFDEAVRGALVRFEAAKNRAEGLAKVGQA